MARRKKQSHGWVYVIWGINGIVLLCLLGAAVSFMRRRRRRMLVGTVTDSDAAAALDGMSWREFELLVGESFRRQGWQVAEQGGAQADGGVDLILRRDRETFVVQCKQWKAFKVGVQVVRELYGVMAAKGARYSDARPQAVALQQHSPSEFWLKLFGTL